MKPKTGEAKVNKSLAGDLKLSICGGRGEHAQREDARASGEAARGGGKEELSHSFPATRTHVVSFRVPLSHDFSQLQQMAR